MHYLILGVIVFGLLVCAGLISLITIWAAILVFGPEKWPEPVAEEETCMW
jgi:hypothetical protein